MRSRLIVVCLMMVTLCECGAVNKDGFNMYKDFLRAKTDEEVDLSELIADDPRAPKLRVSYFYRTPIPAQPGLPRSSVEKRSSSSSKSQSQLFYNMDKRGAGAFLSWALNNRQNYDHESRHTFPGVNRPAPLVAD